VPADAATVRLSRALAIRAGERVRGVGRPDATIRWSACTS
jgi:hypothetical protein